MQYLKQSTAVTVKVGPFIDEDDGKTAETALTIAQADVRLSKNGGDIAQKTEATSCTHDELGIYGCPIDATDTATLGRLQLWVHESGALPVWHEFMILPANVYDSLFSTDLLQVDVTQLLGTAWLTPGVAGTPDVNAKQLGGTSQTGRDVGANVLLSAGSGAGQLDFTSGVVKSNLAQILGTALTETAGYIAAAFKKLFNVETPTLVASDVMRGTNGANTTVPDASGIAAGLHATTDAKIDDVIADTEDLQTQIGTDGAGLTDLGGMSDAMKAEVQVEANDALLAQNLDHLAKIAVDTDLATTVHDDSILGYLMATSGLAGYARTDDALQSIRDAVAAAAPQTHIATSDSLITYGTVDSGTYEDTITDNDVYWQISPVAVNALDMYLQFEIGTGRVPSSVSFNGRFDAHIARWCHVYAYNYLTSSWDQISNEDNRLSHATSDYNREYVLLPAHASAAGQVRIRIATTSVTTGDDLYIDLLTVSSVEAAGAGLTAAAIRNAIYEGDITQHHDHTTMAFHIAIRLLYRGQITAVTSQTEMQDSSLPAVTDLFNNHVVLFHDHTLDTFCLRTIKDMDDSGNIILYHAPAFTVDTDTYIFVLSQKQKVNIIDDNALAQISAEVDTALSDIKLDHLVAVADGDDPVNDSIIAQLAATDGDWSNFAKATDALQAIRDRGDAAWITAVGFSTHTAANVRDAILDDATRFSGASIAAILADVTGIDGDAMRGTNNAALAATALSTAQWTNARAVFLDNINQAGLLQLTAARAAFLDNINNANLATIADISTLTAAEIAHLDADISSRSSHTAANVRDAILDDAIRFSGASIAAILADVTGINGDAIRGTNNSALASICTEARLAELDAVNLPANIDEILLDTGTNGVVVAAGSKIGYALSAAAVDAILDEVVEGTTTMRQMLRIFMAALAGKSAGGGTVTITFRDIADGKNRIAATVDGDGNRTAITLDGT